MNFWSRRADWLLRGVYTLFDLLREFGSAIYADPHHCYASMRDAGPVHRVVLPDGRRCHLVLSYDGALQVLSSEAVSNQPPGCGGGNMLEADPPRHTRLRRTVASAFSQSRVRDLTATIARIVARQVDRLPMGEEVDLVKCFAQVVPVEVIGDVLGVPLASELGLGRWTTDIITSDAGSARMRRARAELTSYVEEVVRDGRRLDPDGLVSELSAQRRTLGVDYADLVSTITLLVVAGHETTVNLIANALLAYVDTPGVANALSSGEISADDLVAETLRHQPPLNLSANRYVVRDLDVAGCRLPGDGMTVITSFAAANRDAERFDRPDLFMPGRRSAGHLGFGSGLHRCPGSSLAVVEAGRAVGELVRRYPRMRRREPTRWLSSCISRSQRSLVVRLDGGTATEHV